MAFNSPPPPPGPPGVEGAAAASDGGISMAAILFEHIFEYKVLLSLRHFL
jgi:hypothetical protein